MMDKEVKEKWLAALKSGEYKKGKGRLKHGEHYCCLGVLCEILGLAKTESDGFYTNDPRMAASVYLPFEVKTKIGLDAIVQEDLACMNDNTDTFDEVIRHIEEKL